MAAKAPAKAVAKYEAGYTQFAPPPAKAKQAVIPPDVVEYAIRITADVEVDDGYDENMTSSSVASDAIAPSPRFFVFNLLYTT